MAGVVSAEARRERRFWLAIASLLLVAAAFTGAAALCLAYVSQVASVLVYCVGLALSGAWGYFVNDWIDG